MVADVVAAAVCVAVGSVSEFRPSVNETVNPGRVQSFED
jgi:hypothetical protein